MKIISAERGDALTYVPDRPDWAKLGVAIIVRITVSKNVRPVAIRRVIVGAILISRAAVMFGAPKLVPPLYPNRFNEHLIGCKNHLIVAMIP